MATRRVTLTLEVDTDAPLEALQRANAYNVEVLAKGSYYEAEVVRADANVIQPEPAAPTRARKTKPRKK